jgi:hypothetical protein
MRSTRALARISAAVLSVVLAGACMHPGRPPHRTSTTTAPTTTTTVPAGDVLRFQRIGGFCPLEGCGTDLHIRADGTWTLDRGQPPTTTTGRLDPAVAVALVRRIDAGIGTIATLRPYAGPCPFAIDAPETIYTFTSQGRTEAASNCTKVFDGNSLIAYVGTIVSHVLNPPPPPQQRLPTLVTWTTNLGDCAWDCIFEISVQTDGEVITKDRDTLAARSFDQATVAELTRRINAEIGTLATLEDATGGCPSGGGGWDITYTFTVAGGPVTVDNCHKVVPGDNALLLYVDRVLDVPTGPPPVPPG